MNLQENINRIKEVMKLPINESKKKNIVKIYMNGQGADDAEEYVGKVVNLPLGDTIPNEPFKDGRYMENNDNVRRMIKKLENNQEELPPIRVMRHPRNPSKYLVLDGHHRRYASIKAGREFIKSIIVPDENIVLMTKNYGEKNQKSIPLNDVKDNDKIINKYFVSDTNSHSFKTDK